MYKMILIFSLFAAGNGVMAQTINGTPNFNELFKQKKTQKRYLTRQIALLQTYYQFLKKGYEISQKGLGIIGEIKDGNFKQHQNYFTTLTVVKPAIKNSAEVTLALDRLEKIERILYRILSGPYKEECNAIEWQDIERVCDDIRNQAMMAKEDLIQVVSDGELQMKDDERLTRIDSLCKTTKSIYTESLEFSSAVEFIWRARAKEKSEIQLVRDLNAQGV